MADVAQQFKQFNVDIINPEETPPKWEGAGVVEEFHPPTLEASVMEYQASGMDMPILLDMGMEALTARLVVNGYFTQVFSTFGRANQTQTEFVAHGGLRSIRGQDSEVTFRMRGNVIHVSQGRVRGRGELPRVNLGIALVYYEVKIGPDTPIIIDVLNMTRVINSNDVLEGMRSAIGLAI